MEELSELRIEYENEKKLSSERKMTAEKYKLEIVQTRNRYDDQSKEYEDLQQQLKECRDEINFLCTTNEDLQTVNNSLNKQLAKYPQPDSMRNSILLEDDKTKNEEESKDDQAGMDGCLDAQRSTSSVFMMECIEDSRIKEEMQRLSLDRNIWNVQYTKIRNEKSALLAKVNEYEQQIEELHHQLITQQAAVPKEGDLTADRATHQQVESLINLQNQNQVLLLEQQEYDKKIKQMLHLNQSSQHQIKILKEEVSKQSLGDGENGKIKQLHTALNVVEAENEKLRRENNDNMKQQQAVSQEIVCIS